MSAFTKRFFEFHHLMMFIMWLGGGLYFEIKSIVIGYLGFLFARMVLRIQPYYSMVIAWAVSMLVILGMVFEVLNR